MDGDDGEAVQGVQRWSATVARQRGAPIVMSTMRDRARVSGLGSWWAGLLGFGLVGYGLSHSSILYVSVSIIFGFLFWFLI
jgi:hypothetical protein